jgi:hypothetical protein
LSTLFGKFLQKKLRLETECSRRGIDSFLLKYGATYLVKYSATYLVKYSATYLVKYSATYLVKYSDSFLVIGLIFKILK